MIRGTVLCVSKGCREIKQPLGKGSRISRAGSVEMPRAAFRVSIWYKDGQVHRPVLVLIHAPWETPALIDVALEGIPTLRRMVIDERSPELPAAPSLGGVVVMGGPQDADDDEGHPGLPLERRLLAAAVDADVPVLGVCLGMQLIGIALGARLHKRHAEEIGFDSVVISSAGRVDPVLAPLATLGSGAPVVLHWHSDAVELPSCAVLLASTSRTQVQAFRAGSALATQFHPEADEFLLANWLTTPEMVQSLAPEEVQRIARDGAKYLPDLRAQALSGLAQFAAAVRARRG